MLGALPVMALVAILPPPPTISAPVALVAEPHSDEILFAKGDLGPQSIASISKLLALKVVFERGLDLTEKTTMKPSDWDHTVGGARTRLVRGRSYSNRDLVHAALLGSDNRAVVALGRAVGLSHASFVTALNSASRKMGLLGATFGDVTGISHENRMSVLGILTLLESVMDIPKLAVITSKAEWETNAFERSGRALMYRNTNLLVRDQKREVLVGKTGFNSAAGWCVASILELRNGRRVAIVVLGAEGKHLRFRDARRLASWVERLPWTAPTEPARIEPSQ